MNGLIAQAQEQRPQEQGPQEQLPQDSGETGEYQGDPAEQAQRSGMMAALGQSMYSEKGLKNTLKMLENGDPVEQTGRSVAYRMLAMHQSINKTGKQVSEDAMMDVGHELIERTLALASNAGLIEFKGMEDYEQAVNKAGEIALATFHKMKEGGTPQEQGPPQAQPPQGPQGPPQGQPQGPPQQGIIQGAV